MKDLVQIWNRVAGRTYNAVNIQSTKDHKPHSLDQGPLDTSALEANFSECETLNEKLENDSFTTRRNAIVNRLFERRRTGHLARLPKSIFLLLMLGLFGILAGCFFVIVHPYDILFRLKVVLADGGEIFELWRKPEVDLYLRVYLFNVTNRDAFLEGREKLNVVEVGPYVYKEHLEHKNVTFNQNGTLSATPMHPLTWVPEMSDGRSEDDVLVMPNIALLAIGDVVANANIFTRLGLNALVRSTKTQPLLEMTAKEFMFGYQSSLVTLGYSFMPGWIKFDKLGLIDRMYDFKGDFETVYTGETDSKISGLIETYRGSMHLPQWQGDYCSIVTNSSDGTKFKSGIEEGEALRFYRKSLCRTALLRPVRNGERNGLSAKKFTFVDNMLDNGVIIEENKCYCRHGKCLHSGLIDVTDCYYGFPIALSYPHFYNGSEHLQSQVDGLYPEPLKHESYFWIQPESGLPLDLAMRFQINMAMNDVSSIANCDKFANKVIPLLWFEIRMFELPDKLANRFWLYLNILPLVEKLATYALFIGGALLSLLSSYKIFNGMLGKSYTNTHKHNNVMIGKEMWAFDGTKRRGSKDFKPVYSPCEVPMNNDGFMSSTSESEDNSTRQENDTKQFFKNLSNRLSNRISNSIDALKEVVTNKEATRRNSKVNVAYNDSSESSLEEPTRKSSLISKLSKSGELDYQMIPVSGSEDDDCTNPKETYLEVLEDGFENINTTDDSTKKKVIERKLSKMNSLDSIRLPKPIERKYSADHISFGTNTDEILKRLPHLKEEIV